MMTPFSLGFAVYIACYQVRTSLALTTSYQKSGIAITLVTPKRQILHHHRSLLVLNSSPILPTDEEDDGNEISSPLSLSAQQINLPQQVSPVSNSPPPIPQKRMVDPLMDRMTRDNPASANLPTRNIPLFGEIPVDGSLMLLVPAVVFAILGFVMSAVIAIKAQDQIFDTFSQATNAMAQSAINQPNQVYDKNVCRGICSTQQDDIEGLYQFMKSITRTNGK